MEQKKFAESIGSADKIVSKWRTSGLKSYWKYLPQIAKVSNVTVDYLSSSDEKKPIPALENRDEPSHDTTMTAFMDGDMDMSPEERDALWDNVYEYARFKAEQWRKKKDQE